MAVGCAQYYAFGGEASSVVTVTKPGRAGQGQGPAAVEPGVVTWAGSLRVAGRGALISTGVAGHGALVSDPERPCQPCLSLLLPTHSFLLLPLHNNGIQIRVLVLLPMRDMVFWNPVFFVLIIDCIQREF